MSEREIPEDVMREARAAFADTKVISASLVAEDEDSDVLPFIIARAAHAILAERERCAKIADDFPDTTNHPAGPLYGAGFAAAVQMMRLAIRQGSPK